MRQGGRWRTVKALLLKSGDGAVRIIIARSGKCIDQGEVPNHAEDRTQELEEAPHEVEDEGRQALAITGALGGAAADEDAGADEGEEATDSLKPCAAELRRRFSIRRPLSQQKRARARKRRLAETHGRRIESG